jgi:hypothetical protein
MPFSLEVNCGKSGWGLLVAKCGVVGSGNKEGS